MALVRDPVPTGGTLAQLRAWLARVLGQLDDWHDTADQQLSALVELTKVQGVIVNWEWDNVTDTTVEPPISTMRGNNNNLSGCTQFSLSGTEIFGRVIDGTRFGLIEPGEQVYITDSTKSASYLFTIDNPVVIQDGGDWYQLNVTPNKGNSANPTDGDAMDVRWLPDL